MVETPDAVLDPSETKALPPPSSDVDGLDILLAEDIRENQVLAVEILRRAGHTVRVASNGREAVEEWERSRPALILMDIQMPEMGGVDATREIRAREQAEGTHTPIVALTAHAIKGDRERYLQTGMDDYVSKPIRRAELFRAIDRVARRRLDPRDVTASAPVDR